jgi:hypothetical protein
MGSSEEGQRVRHGREKHEDENHLYCWQLFFWQMFRLADAAGRKMFRIGLLKVSTASGSEVLVNASDKS